MSDPDLTYSEGGLFVTFYAETPAGEAAWNEMAAKNDGVARFFTPQLPGILAQLRAAGYRVTKAKPQKPVTPDELDRLLAEIEEPLS